MTLKAFNKTTHKKNLNYIIIVQNQTKLAFLFLQKKKDVAALKRVDWHLN